MDQNKRDFLKLGTAGAVGAALAGGTAASEAQASPRDKTVSRERTQHLVDQTELVSEAAVTMKGRAEFLADPAGYARERGISLDPDFEAVVYNELRSIESSFVLQGAVNPHLRSRHVDLGIKGREIDGLNAQNAPVPVAVVAVATTTTTTSAAASTSAVAVAAVVAAAAAVVSAAVAVYMALQYED